MKHNLKTFPDYMADGKLYRVGESIDWVTFGLQCQKWKEEFGGALRQLLNTRPSVDVDWFWEQWKKTGIAKWDKEDPFNAYIMGYMDAMEAVLGDAED